MLCKIAGVLQRCIKNWKAKVGSERYQALPHAMKRQNSQGLAYEEQVFEAGFATRVARKGSRGEEPERKGRGSNPVD
jgi:hypothetical protein